MSLDDFDKWLTTEPNDEPTHQPCDDPYRCGCRRCKAWVRDEMLERKWRDYLEERQ